MFLDGLEEEMAMVTSMPSADFQPIREKRRPHLAASSSLATGREQKQEAKSRLGPGGGSGSFGVLLITLTGLAVVMQIACKLGPFDLLTFLWGHVCLGKWFC